MDVCCVKIYRNFSSPLVVVFAFGSARNVIFLGMGKIGWLAGEAWLEQTENYYCKD